MPTSYVPSQDILQKYADVLVKFALNSGQGVKPGEVVQVMLPDVAKPLGLELQRAILESGAHPWLRMIPTGFDRSFYQLASDDQLTFFPEKYYRERVNVVDHSIHIIADVDPEELKGIDPSKIFKARDSKKKIRDWQTEKENRGEFTWTIGLWGMEAQAIEVGLTIEEYWQQIIQACFLDQLDPIQAWRDVFAAQERVKATLNAMSIESVHIVGPDADLTVRIGATRSWEGGSGRNIPSFEIFTSPDWRGTQGWIRFSEPLYRYGNIVKNIRLEFKDGLVTKATAEQGQTVLEEMLKSNNADKLGEFSLTDKRFSKITHTMAETLFDENIGGPFGNTHVAIGMAYKDCYKGDPATVKPEEWEKMGYNDSPEHTDFVSTTDRTVTATLADGSQVVIYKDGMFAI
jgi:aminopeptidase